MSNIISKYGVIVLVLVLLPILLVEYFTQNESPRHSQPNLDVLLAELNQIWELGVYEKQNHRDCADIPVEAEALQCSSLAMLCYLKTKAKVTDSDINSKGDLRVSLERNGRSFALRFRNTCHRVSLKEKVYSAGPAGVTSQIWSAEGQDIKIDRFYAQKNGKLITDFSFRQQQDFCLTRGGVVLQSHVFDAATFYPTSGAAGLQLKPKYPWTKSSRLNEDCQKMATKGCKPLGIFDRRGASWSGIFQALGGGVESLDNPFDPRANLKVSSLNFSYDNPWHQLGLRASWDGESFGTMNLEEQYEKRLKGVLDLKEVVFRCMYY